MKKNLLTLAIAGIVLTTMLAFSFISCNTNEKTVKEFDEFLTAFEAKLIPLYKEYSLASWNANLSGKDEDYAKAAELEYKLNLLYCNKDDFKKLEGFKNSGAITDTIKKRELELLYNVFKGNQVDTLKLKKIIDMESYVEKTFNTFRPVVGTDTLSDNQIEEILKTSTDSKKLEETWLATKKSGESVADSVKKLIMMRNEIAKDLGYSNYHEMRLKLAEQDPNEIEKIYDELDSLTKDGFANVKEEMDTFFAKRYNIKKADLMPWHYQNRFFQEAPKIYDIDLDQYFKGKSLEQITQDYFKNIGLDISDLLEKSDLYEKEGKYPHAQCADMDNEGDVRVMCNIDTNEYWMNTMLHEFGHAAYDKYIDNKNLPYILRDPAHTFTTEAIAELFGRFASNPQWLQDVVGISADERKKIEENVNKNLRLQMLVFSRWSQVMYRFEKSMYEKPDQDLNKLWWDLVEKYQLLKKPEGRNAPDWASKIHVATVPCYYHNYLLGELLASQLHYYMTKNLLKSDDYVNQSYYNHPEIGKYLIDNMFKPGAKYYWNDLIEKATGEKLTAKYYAKQFVE